MLVDPGDQTILAAGDDGLPFDPVGAGACPDGRRIGPVIPKSLRISGTVADWESWTDMQFPETGDYVFPEGLATVRIDREQDTGTYWEANDPWPSSRSGQTAVRPEHPDG